MGVYLNDQDAYDLFCRDYASTYYVDKTEILKELVLLVESDENRIEDSGKIFRNLKVSKYDWFEEHLNKHNVIHIVFNEMPDEVTSYAHYISRIKKCL